MPLKEGICLICWKEENAERAKRGEWTPGFMVDMGPHVPCKKHSKKARR